MVSACIEVVVVLSVALSILRLVEEWRVGSRLVVKSLSSVGSCVLRKGAEREEFSLAVRARFMQFKKCGEVSFSCGVFESSSLVIFVVLVLF